MDIKIRPMRPEENKEVRAIGRKAFTGFEKLFVSKPKDALVAEVEGKKVGAILYKIFTVNNIKIGYIDFAFTDPTLHGKGIGKVLYDQTIQHLWDLGCNYVSGVVKDDNVGSWGLFLKSGLKRVSVVEMIRELGFVAASKLLFATSFFFAIGMEFYLAVKDGEQKSHKQSTARQLPTYLVVNLLLFSLYAIRVGSPLKVIIAMALLLSGTVLSGFIGTKFYNGSWHFRLTDGGFGLSTICYLIGGIMPMIGNWYPNEYKKGNDLTKAMGVTALAQWLFLLTISNLGIILPEALIPLDIMSQIAPVFLVLYTLAFYPFESFGGARVFRWNKIVYIVMAVLSLVTVYS